MLWIDEPRLEHERVRDHRVVLRVGVLLDVEVLLDDPLGVGEERPLRADRRAELLAAVVVVGRDRGDLGVGHGDLRIERGELQVLLVLLRAVVAAREREDQRIVALQLAEPRGTPCDRAARSRERRRRGRCRRACSSLLRSCRGAVGCAQGSRAVSLTVAPGGLPGRCPGRRAHGSDRPPHGEPETGAARLRSCAIASISSSVCASTAPVARWAGGRTPTAAGRRTVRGLQRRTRDLRHRRVRARSAQRPAGWLRERASALGDGRGRVRPRASGVAGWSVPVRLRRRCAALLGAVPAVRDVCGSAGLLFVDGHEDATTMDESTTGEVANMEVALLLGMTGETRADPMRSRLPVLRPEAIAMLGQRDANYRGEIGEAEHRGSLPSMARRSCARSRTDGGAGGRPRRRPGFRAGAARRPGRARRKGVPRVRAASDPAMPEGLSGRSRLESTRTALQTGGCRGWSVAVYNPDLDPDGREASRVAAYLDEVTKHAGAGTAT